MSTRAYGFSALAALVLIGAAAAPAAHKFFTAAPGGGPGHAMPQKLLVDGHTVIRELNGQELEGRQLRIELADPAAESRGDFRGRAAGGGRW